MYVNSLSYIRKKYMSHINRLRKKKERQQSIYIYIYHVNKRLIIINYC